jgi:hypothetical protein
MAVALEAITMVMDSQFLFHRIVRLSAMAAGIFAALAVSGLSGAHAGEAPRGPLDPVKLDQCKARAAKMGWMNTRHDARGRYEFIKSCMLGRV